MWAKDGQTLKVPIAVPQFFAPLAPLLPVQLKRAGFDASTTIDNSSAWSDNLLAGKSDITVFVHCGSITEPFETLQDLHSKYSRPIGTPTAKQHRLDALHQPRVRQAHRRHGEGSGLRRQQGLHGQRRQGAGHLSPGHAGNHAPRRALGDHVQQHVLDWLAKRGGSVRRPVSLLGSVESGRPQDQASAVRPGLGTSPRPLRRTPLSIAMERGRSGSSHPSLPQWRGARGEVPIPLHCLERPARLQSSRQVQSSRPTIFLAIFSMTSDVLF